MTEKVTEAQAPMDRIRAEGIVDRINAYLSGGVSVTRICAECEGGIRSDQLEKLMSEQALRPLTLGDWFGSPRATETLISLEKWADEEDRDNERQLDDYAVTEIFRQVYGILNVAHKARSLVAITGTYGVGKTFAARRYAMDNPRRPNEPGAVWFEFPPGTKGDSGVLDAVLSALDPYGAPSGSVNAKLDRVLTLLKPGDFLVADECGLPAEKGTGLRFMAYIHERARVPIAMIGNPAFHAAVWGKRTDYDALASRTRHTSLDGNSAEDVAHFMDWLNLSGRRLKDSILAVVRQPGRDGGLRGAVTVLNELKAREMEVTAENFISIAKQYGRME